MEDRIGAIRSFNRFYARQLGILHEGLARSPFSLTQVRILFEMANQPGITASELREKLDLDAGYLSRIVQSFEEQGLVRRKPSEGDARRAHLSLTAKGRKTFTPLDASAQAEVSAMVGTLAEPEQVRLVQAMTTIRRLLEPGTDGAYTLRPHRPGDIGWVIQRHGEIYYAEYGWDERFEAIVAGIASKFIAGFDPRQERCWIAERGGERLGCIFAVRHSATVAKLRLLLVEPHARGCGVGKRLVEECIAFARQAGYRKLTLWTDSILTAARTIYRNAGFRLVKETPHQNFGHALMGETWELKV
ncbi:MAG: bifunctional helix-turn-helix transcriptional regulator/GNAT family N-acetyltransferase [Acidobacteria bacterium]|nr:bifunctional helix-turn-helix transcriptional regulator/GNAT family N-acetyltransferase [Acidobacteriota bacterium]